MVRYIEEAVKWAMRGALDAMTTCPINKQAINKAGYSFPGHTEFLAHLTQSLPRGHDVFGSEVENCSGHHPSPS